MNTPVSYSIAKLLDSKGVRFENGQDMAIWWAKEILIRPTIADVVMWLYEKHGIWISVKKDYHNGALLGFESMIDNEDGFIDCGTFDTSNEAYEAAIEYTLNSLIN